MISSAATSETMPQKLRPRGRRLASTGLEETQERAKEEESVGVNALAGGMELKATSDAIHGTSIEDRLMVREEVCGETLYAHSIASCRRPLIMRVGVLGISTYKSCIMGITGFCHNLCRPLEVRACPFHPQLAADEAFRWWGFDVSLTKWAGLSQPAHSILSWLRAKHSQGGVSRPL